MSLYFIVTFLSAPCSPCDPCLLWPGPFLPLLNHLPLSSGRAFYQITFLNPYPFSSCERHSTSWGSDLKFSCLGQTQYELYPNLDGALWLIQLDFLGLVSLLLSQTLPWPSSLSSLQVPASKLPSLAMQTSVLWKPTRTSSSVYQSSLQTETVTQIPFRKSHLHDLCATPNAGGQPLPAC